MLFRDEQRVALTPKVLETLLVLVEANGKIVSKDELMQKVWPDTFVDESSLTANISVLRKTLATDGEPRPYIETIPKRGYRFFAPVKALANGSSVSTIPVREPKRRRLKILWIAAGLVVLAVLGALLAWRRSETEPLASRKRLMVVVLPVQNLTGDPEREYIGDGLTEEIIAELSRFSPERMAVIARTSSMAYKGTHKTVAQIGRELGVDYAVEGSFRADGDHLRITSQLIRVQDQTHLWSADYNRTLHDLFSLEDEVAQAVAVNIGIKLRAATRASVSVAPPADPDAYVASGRTLLLEQAVARGAGTCDRSPAACHSARSCVRIGVCRFGRRVCFAMPDCGRCRCRRVSQS